MSAELQSMLRFQAGRVATGEISAAELADYARAFLELERGTRVAYVAEKENRAALKANFKVLPGGAG